MIYELSPVAEVEAEFVHQSTEVTFFEWGSYRKKKVFVGFYRVCIGFISGLYRVHIGVAWV